MNIKKKVVSLVAVMTLCIASIVPVNAMEINNDFKSLMKYYNVTIVGKIGEMTVSDVQEYMGENVTDNTKVLHATSKISATDILEQHYNSLNKEEQQAFLDKIKNQTVDVQQQGDILIISYNIDTLNARSTKTITSRREATIYMKDSVLGERGSATVDFVAKFTKTTSGKKWSVTIKKASDCSVKETNSLPVQILQTDIYWGYGYVYSSSSAYKGNEFNAHTYTQVCCGAKSATIEIYLYPNSSYNYSKVKED